MIGAVIERVYMFFCGERVRKVAGVDIDGSSVVNFTRIKNISNKNVLRVLSGTIVEARIDFECLDAAIFIGSNTFIGNSHIVCSKEINIGSNVLISWGCTIVDHDSHSIQFSLRKKDVSDWFVGKKDWSTVAKKPVCIMDNSWVGFNSIILKGVTVGEGAIVGAGSVVTKDVPPWTIVAGNPARIIREIPEHER